MEQQNTGDVQPISQLCCNDEHIRVVESFVTLLSTARVQNNSWNGSNYESLLENAARQISLLFKPQFDEKSSEICCSFPSLLHRSDPIRIPNDNDFLSSFHRGEVNSDVRLPNTNEGKALSKIGVCNIGNYKLGSCLSMTYNDLQKLPQTILNVFTESFLLLFDRRLRLSLESIAKDYQRCLSLHCRTGSNTSSNLPQKMLDLMGETATIKLDTIVTRFRPSSSFPICLNSTSEINFHVPMDVGFQIDLTFLGKAHTLKIESGGTIDITFAETGSLHRPECQQRCLVPQPLLQYCSINLDTAALLRGMMTQARAIVNVSNNAIKSALKDCSVLFKQMEEVRNHGESINSNELSYRACNPSDSTTTTEKITPMISPFRKMPSFLSPRVEGTSDTLGYSPNLQIVHVSTESTKPAINFCKTVTSESSSLFLMDVPFRTTCTSKKFLKEIYPVVTASNRLKRTFEEYHGQPSNHLKLGVGRDLHSFRHISDQVTAELKMVEPEANSKQEQSSNLSTTTPDGLTFLSLVVKSQRELSAKCKQPQEQRSDVRRINIQKYSDLTPVEEQFSDLTESKCQIIKGRQWKRHDITTLQLEWPSWKRLRGHDSSFLKL